MRLFYIALLALLLAACVTPPVSTTQRPEAHLVNPAPSTLSNFPPHSALVNTAQAQNPAQLSRPRQLGITSPDKDHQESAGDLWSRVRSGFQMPDLENDLVQKQLARYASRPDHIARMTERSKRYLFYIVEALEVRQMPTELALLPFIESAYNPRALSVAKAAGIWQFVPATGREYDLAQNLFRDERHDVLASTNAALDYLSKLHDMFGDWHLALAAYDWGMGNVQRAIERNRRAGLPPDYASLRMPNETRNYVPKLQAIKEIVFNPQQYHVELADIPNRPYFSTVTITRDMDIQVAARLAGLSLQEFRALNPSFSKPVIVGAAQSKILLPFKNARKFEAALQSYDGALSSWTTHTVAKRIRPSELAEKINVDPITLVSVNKIPSARWIKPGSTLLVPRDSEDDEDISAEVAENARLAFEPVMPNVRRRVIRIRRRQSIAAFAKRYRVSVAQLRRWNRTRRAQLAPGQVMILYQPAPQMRARVLGAVTVRGARAK